ncbi:hypothetical protein WJX72_007198 [[Myrmecia] bisecta]|uniref:Uncharacterized protein n=1 Tax=[Myrmecia] bisecta TaxID=41462 RepID=A0AAW1Q508_9CHLO
MATQFRPEDESKALKQTIEHLKSEVLRLQKELGELHNSDLNALRRAHATLCQHIQALQEEKAGIQERLAGLNTELITPESIATELGVTGGVIAAVYFAGKLVRQTPFRDINKLQRGTWILGSVYLGWRFVTHSVRRLGFWAWDNHRRKHDLVRQWHTVEDRIEIMSSLTSWGPPAAICPPDGSDPAAHVAIDIATLRQAGEAASNVPKASSSSPPESLPDPSAPAYPDANSTWESIHYPDLAPSAPRGGGSGPSIRQYNYNVAPPIVGGYGYGGYGYGGGFSLFPSFGVPIFGFGSFFNIIFFMFVASTVLSVVRGVLNRGRRNNDDDFDD